MMGHWEQDHPRSPHKIFNAFVHKHVEFTPLDGDRSILEGEADVGPVDIGGFYWDKISQGKPQCFVGRHLLISMLVPKLLEELSYTIFSFFTQGDVSLWWVEQESLVEYGIAHFLQGPSTGGKERQVVVDEPLALLSVTRYFETHSYTLTGNVRQKLQSNKGAAFEEAVLLAMTRLLQGQNRLRDILEFNHETPPWANCTAKIVARNSSGEFEAFAIEGSFNPRSTFAFSAKSPEDVASWLESGVAGWCIPDIQMGPDLMARLQLDDGQLLLLIVQAKCYFSGNIDTLKAEVSAKAIESLIPERFYKSIVRNQLIPSYLSLSFLCL